MIDLLSLHKLFIGNHVKEGDIAVDFTMGNGHDTAYLSKAVGESGHVYAFDIQQQALDSTRKTLAAEGCPDNVTLIHDSHHNLKQYVNTLPAIRDAIELLDRDGILNIAIYPGHKEGDEEGKLVCEYLASLSRFKVCVTRVQIINSPTSPYFLMVETKP